ncbi:3'-5' exonuclease [Comamonas sp. GB3 AK4-5]|uniref:3'-5' exonuclease n=1 Tax=Comamonas sp. GB3 AK4-5 TaxID=3231487 RepID=UPI00351E72F8
MPRLKPPTKEESQLLPLFAALPDHAIVLPASDAAFAQARQALLAQHALGFDTESKPIFSTHQVDTGPHLVQLATPDAAWLLQLHHPQALALAREVLSHPGICKVGFGLDNDQATLPRRLGCELVNVLDLDRVFKQQGYGASTGVRAAMALVLGQNFHKSKKQSTSNWAALQLSPSQLRYAANDAHGPALVYAALPAWLARQPAPAAQRPRRPRPAQDTRA